MDHENSPAGVDARATEDDLFQALGAAPRRTIIAHLAARSTPATVAELAAEIERRDVEDGASERTDADRQRLLLALTHVHLPTLRGTDLVSWDPSADAVALTPRGEHLSLQYPTAGDPGQVTLSFRLPASR